MKSGLGNRAPLVGKWLPRTLVRPSFAGPSNSSIATSRRGFPSVSLFSALRSFETCSRSSMASIPQPPNRPSPSGTFPRFRPCATRLGSQPGCGKVACFHEEPMGQRREEEAEIDKENDVDQNFAVGSSGVPANTLSRAPSLSSFVIGAAKGLKPRHFGRNSTLKPRM